MALTDTDPGFLSYERQLALVDEVIGLRAALAEEASRNSATRVDVEAAEARAAAFQKSTTWKVGRLILAPLRLASKAFPRSNEW